MALRARLGMSAREFGQVLGVTLSAVQRWEWGHRAVPPPVARLLFAIARDPALLGALRDVGAA